MKSDFFKLDLKDLSRGLLLVIMTAFLTGILTILEGDLIFSWETIKPILFTSLAAGISYILKNLLTNSKDMFLTGEP